MKKFRITLLVLLVGSLAACGTTHRAAPVTERTIGGTGTAKSATDDRNFYTVKKGDTLYRIALDFGQSYSELVTWNKLANPNDIKVDQVLRVAPPDAPVVRSGGAQTGAVATASGTEARSLSAPAGSTAGNKTSPRGEKRPYSDSTLAEMQKSEGNAASTPPKAVASSDKPAEAPAAATEDETVSWMWPAEGKLVATFDDNKKGIDIAGKSGQQVLAAGAGKVMYAGSGIRGYGNLVIVKHTSTLLSAYAHNKAIHVKEGQSVSKGQKIADMGDSDADTVKLHFEIRQQGKPVDPSKFLPSR
ncbi:peptidoglycan DD-metalloendopeptidase family protein [Herminiimonas fonticola]|uniref:peptidoglycan DD-metalloendopeptidase family protein n=1 Tax=Herminiimonas fonticola TaxID=303380 RepID=UPI0033406858